MRVPEEQKPKQTHKRFFFYHSGSHNISVVFILLRGIIANRTFGIHENLYPVSLTIFNNIWSYQPWSPVRGTIVNRTKYCL